MHRGWMNFGGAFEAVFGADLQVHTGGMGQKYAKKMGQTTPERRRQFYALHTPLVPDAVVA